MASRAQRYERLLNSSPVPVPRTRSLPDSIDWTKSETSETFERHRYLVEDERFSAGLNAWESELVKEELRNGAV